MIEALDVSITDIIKENGMANGVNEMLIKNAGEALRYDGFNLEERIKVNTYKIKIGLKAKPLSFKETNLTLNDVLSVCVQIGLMRGNSTRDKLISQTAADGRPFMTEILNLTKQEDRQPTRRNTLEQNSLS